MESVDYFDSNDLTMNIMFVNYLSSSQSGTYDYLFDYNYIPTDIKPKINIIKRTSPLSKKKIVFEQNIVENKTTPHCDNKK
jgi:hypothetical protein